MGRVVMEVPNTLGTCHHIKVIGFVSGRDDDRVVTSRHENYVAVFDSHRLVQIARVAVNALEDKALRRIDPMIVGFLELAFYRHIVDVMLVGRIT